MFSLLRVVKTKWQDKTPNEYVLKAVSGKSEYEITFAVDAWKSLTPQEKEHHSLEQCKQCYTDFYNVQSIFPAKPIYMATCEIVSINKPVEMKNHLSKLLLSHLMKFARRNFITLSLTHFCHASLALSGRKPNLKKKAERRKIMKQCRDACTRNWRLQHQSHY